MFCTGRFVVILPKRVSLRHRCARLQGLLRSRAGDRAFTLGLKRRAPGAGHPRSKNRDLGHANRNRDDLVMMAVAAATGMAAARVTAAGMTSSEAVTTTRTVAAAPEEAVPSTAAKAVAAAVAGRAVMAAAEGVKAAGVAGVAGKRPRRGLAEAVPE